MLRQNFEHAPKRLRLNGPSGLLVQSDLHVQNGPSGLHALSVQNAQNASLARSVLNGPTDGQLLHGPAPQEIRPLSKSSLAVLVGMMMRASRLAKPNGVMVAHPSVRNAVSAVLAVHPSVRNAENSVPVAHLEDPIGMSGAHHGPSAVHLVRTEGNEAPAVAPASAIVLVADLAAAIGTRNLFLRIETPNLWMEAL